MNTRVAVVAPSRRPRYLEPIVPVVFPEEELVPETQLHLELRTLLYQLLSDYLGEQAAVGSEQFIYYAADDPRQCLAPDAYVKLGPKSGDVTVWKTWERGAPEVAVEIVSDSDTPELSWREKLSRYARLGVTEVVRFDPKGPPQERLRVWDRVAGSLVEREVKDAKAPSCVLNLTWALAPTGPRPVTLRIAEDEAGQRLVPTQAEARIAEAKGREAETKAREAEAKAREAEAKAREVAEERARKAEQRVLELEAELLKR